MNKQAMIDKPSDHPFSEVAKDPALALELLTMQHNKIEEMRRENRRFNRMIWSLLNDAGGWIRFRDIVAPHDPKFDIAIFVEDMTIRLAIAKEKPNE